MKQNVNVSIDVPHGYVIIGYRPPQVGEFILEESMATKVMRDSPYLHQDLFILRPKISWKVGDVFQLTDAFNRNIYYIIAQYSENVIYIINITEGKIENKTTSSKLLDLMEKNYEMATKFRNFSELLQHSMNITTTEECDSLVKELSNQE